MAGHEVWNFINKFYNLYNTGKNASLVLKSQNGKVVINLQLDLDDLVLPPPQPSNKSHRSPSRVRRTQRRARAQAEAAAENDTHSTSNNLVAAVEAAAPLSPTDAAEQAVIVTEEITNLTEQANYDTRSSKDTIDDVAAKVVQTEVDKEDIDINFNVKVYNPFSPLQMKKELDEHEPASTDYPSSPRQPSSAPSSCGSPSRHSSSSAEPCSPQGTPGTSRINGKRPDTDMSFNLDSKFENMELRLEQMVRNLEKNLENRIEAESNTNM